MFEYKLIALDRFDSNLVMEKISKRLWRTYRDFVYYIDGGDEITVPAGFVTDFASIPRVFWIFMPPDDIYSQAAVLHDYLYNTKMFNRDRCDKLFLQAMEILGVGKFTRYTMYYAVRSFGWYPFYYGKRT